LVNAALAAWPALRRTDAGEKADLVAVCMYLARGPVGAIALNDALRAGAELPVDSYTACLVSGLGRLPLQRRAVLRQLDHDPGWECGTVLTNEGFLSASVGHAVTTEGAAIDLLILPVSAHRTAELVANRGVDEAVFLPGRRFKVVAVRTAETTDEDDDGDGRPVVPPVAYLARELAPSESEAEDADARDEAAVTRLDRSLRDRRRRKPDLVDDGDVSARLTAPMPVLAP
jgi:hypothetical protein